MLVSIVVLQSYNYGSVRLISPVPSTIPFTN